MAIYHVEVALAVNEHFSSLQMKGHERDDEDADNPNDDDEPNFYNGEQRVVG